TALTHFGESSFFEFSEDFFGSQNRQPRHTIYVSYSRGSPDCRIIKGTGQVRRHWQRRELERQVQMFQPRFVDLSIMDFRMAEWDGDKADYFQKPFRDKAQQLLSACFWLERSSCLERRHPIPGKGRNTHALL